MITTTTILIAAIATLVAICITFWLNLNKANRTIERLDFELEIAKEELSNVKIELGITTANLHSLEEQKSLIKEEQELRNKTLADQFKGMAADIIKEQTANLNKSSKESLELLLKPFQAEIKEFKERVNTIHSAENTQRGELKNELKNLIELNQKITTETNSLTNALRGNSKIQGDWGEMILEKILESSNLIKGTHYTTQENLKGEEGENLRPDVILKLPENKSIVIDSKTSITAFVNSVQSDTEEQSKRHLAEHVTSIKLHIKELANKNYQKLLHDSPDFVIMFIPNEPAFLAAMQADPTLWAEAYDSKVIVSSPTNLFAMLKLVNDIWRRDAQDKNTEKIAAQGAKLYDQLTLFVESLDEVGTALAKAQTSYDKAYERLATGRANALKQGEELKRLGVKNKRDLSEKARKKAELE